MVDGSSAPPPSLTSAAAYPGVPYPPTIAFPYAVRRSLEGITLLGAALGVAATRLALNAFVPWSPVSGFEALLASLGFVFLLMYPSALGVHHRRWVFCATGAAALAGIVGITLTFSYVQVTGWESHATAFRGQVLRATIVVLLASVSAFLATYALQDIAGKALLGAAVVAGIAIQAYLWIALNDAIDRALVAAISGGGYTPFDAFEAEWRWLGAWNAVPMALFLVAYERLYWHLRKRYFPGASLWNV